MEIVMKPIGYIETPFKDRSGTGPQANYEVCGTIHVDEKYREGIADIAPGSQCVLLFHFHMSEGYKLTTRSHRDNQIKGVFSTRSPFRPNGIGMSIVEVLSNDGCNIVFRGVDMLDNTPLLDIKPHIGDTITAR